MLSAVAPVTVQLSVVLWPGAMDAGELVNMEITGTTGGTVPLPNMPNWSAASPLPIAPMLPPAPSCGSPAPSSGLPDAGVYIARYMERTSDTFLLRLQISSGRKGNGVTEGWVNFGFTCPLSPPRS